MGVTGKKVSFCSWERMTKLIMLHLPKWKEPKRKTEQNKKVQIVKGKKNPYNQF